MSSSFASAADYKKIAALFAVVGGVLSALGFIVDKQQFFASYLEGFMWVSAIPFGALGMLMVHTLTGGNWGWTIRPFLVSAAKTIPFLAVLFFPLVFGMHELYMWTNHDLVHHDPVLTAKVGYLNEKFWLIRQVFYFGSWSILNFLLLRRLVPTPAQIKDTKILFPAQRVAAGGILFFMLTISFASIDWVMSIEPHWFSSVFGAVVVATQVMSAFSFSVLCMIVLDRKTPNLWMTQNNVHDLGKFIFMTVMLWGYLSLSQYLIIWGGNLPEETFWYHERSIGGWQFFSAILVVFQFIVPFCWLLSKHVKRNVKVLPWIILLLFIVRLLEQLYLVKPGLFPGRFPLHWMDLAVPLTLAGVWGFLYFGILSKAVSIPAPAGGHGHGHDHHGPQDKAVTKPH